MKKIDKLKLCWEKDTKEINNKLFSFYKNLLLIIFAPLVMVLSSELIEKQSVIELIKWINSGSFLLSYFGICLVFCIVYMLIGNAFWGVLVTSTLIMIFSLINYYKIIILGAPFYPWDLLLAKQLKNILSYLNIHLSRYVLISLLVFVLLVCTSYVIVNKSMIGKLSKKTRLLTSILCIFMLQFFTVNILFNSEALARFNVVNLIWDPKINFDQNGFLLGFTINIPNILIKEPQNYNRKAVSKIVDNVRKEETLSSFKSDTVKPNIIIIMNEAFWDIEQFRNVNFSTKPLKNFNILRKEATYGNLLSPTFGGFTSNVEFEVLTGFSNYFLPKGAVPYQQHINRPIDSIASYLLKHEYNTIAVHPYRKWFWEREKVYNLMGFNYYVSDKDFIEPEIKGFFTSDMEVSREIIRQYENNKNNPNFIFAVTMQNHGPYQDNRYGETNLIEDEWDEVSKKILETYTQGVKDADRALGYLVNYFRQEDNPTIIVMFGDHAPMLGDNYHVYRETGYISSEGLTVEDNYKLYTVPFVIWKNYDDTSKDLGTISANYLGMLTMKEAGLPLPQYFKLLDGQVSMMPAFIKGLLVTNENDLITEPTEEQEEILDRQWLLQYDLMFGEEYGKD